MSFNMPIMKDMHIAYNAFPHGKQAICDWIDYFSSRDNESQLGFIWRNSCFPEINILFGSPLPSSKILIGATMSLYPQIPLLPFVINPLGSLCVFV